MNKFLIIFLIIFFSFINETYGMIEEHGYKKYTFLVFKNNEEIENPKSLSLVNKIYYEENGCICIIHPSKSTGRYIQSLFTSHTAIPIAFLRGKKLRYFPGTVFKEKEYVNFPKEKFDMFFMRRDMFYMRNDENLNFYIHPLPFVGYYINSTSDKKEKSFQRSIKNFLRYSHFKINLSTHETKYINSKIIEYYKSKDEKPLMISIKEEKKEEIKDE